MTRSDAHFTESGLDGLELVPWGTHACHFYNGRDELLASLVPYIMAGLRARERCIWIAARPLPAREAMQALRTAWHSADDAIQTGALRILDFDRWYTSSLIGADLADLWLAEEERALADGYAGLRISGNLSFMTPDGWPAFRDYERSVTDRFAGRRIVALCSYVLKDCGDQQMQDVLEAHNCALERRDAHWQVLPPAQFHKPRQESERDR
ncbi:MAG TPA: MEDS domain-containing protein [Vitreimonas sp.]|uniref:MEDS domain-containing protein n=1 Tax=Vitreimonas sp. TaxID=3069702 RepID=UPI002D6E0963|nr:MEDS domain-containing protein [Vitreimonas sp.]HYD86908.1 MEDS domain-containing protein [Vitreimonas sp.]